MYVCVSKKSQSNYFTHGIIIRSPVRKTPLKFINFILSEIKYTIVLSMIIFVPSLLFSFIVSIFFFLTTFSVFLMSLAMVVIAVVVLSLFLHYLLFSLPTYRRYQLAAPLTINSLSRSLSLLYVCTYILKKKDGWGLVVRAYMYVPMPSYICTYICGEEELRMTDTHIYTSIYTYGQVD